MPPKRKAPAQQPDVSDRAARRARRADGSAAAATEEEEAAPVELPAYALESDEQGLFSAMPDELLSRIFVALADVRCTGRAVRDMEYGLMPRQMRGSATRL